MPRIEREVVTQTHGRFVIAPLERGYGTVTSIRVTGVHHEFSPIPGAKEDMIQFILNVKQLRLRLHSGEPMRMRLIARGPGEVTAADIEAPSQVEIVNPELHLLTLDSEESEVEVEFQVEHGRGFSPANERGRLPIDEIPVDAIFSPIRRVRYDVEPERVGQSHDFDRLVISIWTDGTISPESALKQAAEILVQHFSVVVGGAPVLQVVVPEVEVEEKDGVDSGIPASVYNRPIEDLGLQVRAYNCLKRAGITNVGQVLERLQKGRDEMLAIRNFGEKSLEELLAALEAKGYLQYLADTQSETE